MILVIATAFGLAAGLEVSGLADGIAALIGHVAGGLGPRAVLAVLMIATIALKSTITNNAAAALMFPLALSSATELGLNLRAMTVAITIAASTSFLTPVAYQTNLMVYGPAGYRFGDYARLGLPLTILVILIALVVVPLAWGLQG